LALAVNRLAYTATTPWDNARQDEHIDN